MNRYDHLGRRVQKIAPDGTHTFLYDGWRPVVETVAKPSGGTDRIEYHWGKDLSGSLDGAAGVGGLLYVKRNGAIYVPFCDAFGNVMGYCDEQGNVVAEYAYDAFGRMVAQSGALADAFAIRYSTKYYDAETGMYYYGRRYYVVMLCRWLTRDPIEEQGGVNLYGFCGNNAVIFYDAFGLVKVWVIPMGGDANAVIKGVNDVPVYPLSSRTLNGLFESFLNVTPCEITITLRILLNENLVDKGNPNVTYYFTPHDVEGGKGGSSSSDGSPQIRGGILAHERGHALSFLTTFLFKFKREIRKFGDRRLTESEQREVEEIFNRCLSECKPEDSASANQAHMDWYKEHGYKSGRK